MDITEFRSLYRDKLMEAFRYTIGFLNSHHLTWWVLYGTCLGTIRHAGLIPWDDDIDIGMPREDYEKLIEVSTELIGTKYELCTLRNYAQYIAYGKIIDKTTTYVENERIPIVSGVWIDIFPLDRCDNNFHVLKKIKHYNSSIEKYHLSLYDNYLIDYLYSDIIHGHFGSVFKGIKSYIYKMPRCKVHVYERALAESQNFNDSNGNFYCDVASYWEQKEKCFLPAVWFEKQIDKQFEDIVVKVPAKYDDYLKFVYGDYMTPPSVIPSGSHCVYYCNLSERVTFERVIEDVKSGIHIVY